jgi:hypothetical protein
LIHTFNVQLSDGRNKGNRQPLTKVDEHHWRNGSSLSIASTQHCVSGRTACNIIRRGSKAGRWRSRRGKLRVSLQYAFMFQGSFVHCYHEYTVIRTATKP